MARFHNAAWTGGSADQEHVENLSKGYNHSRLLMRHTELDPGSRRRYGVKHHVMVINGKISVNPLRPNSDQREVSPCNINAFSVREVMRIKDMITQHEFAAGEQNEVQRDLWGKHL